LRETFAMSFGRGLGYFGLLRLDRLGLRADPLLSRRQRLIELLSGALLMPVRSDNRLAPIVGIERPMVDHALEAVFLYLVALAVQSGPLKRCHSALDLRGTPVHQGLTLGGLDNHKVTGIIWAGHLPVAAIALGAVFQRPHLCGLKAVEAVMLVVIEHAEQTQTMGVESTGHRHRIDSTVNDKESAAGRQGHLLTVCNNDLRQMQVGWI